MSREDYFQCSKKIAISAFESLNSSFLSKFASNAAQFDDGKSIAATSMIGVLDAMGHLLLGELHRAASILIQLESVLAYHKSEFGALLDP